MVIVTLPQSKEMKALKKTLFFYSFNQLPKKKKVLDILLYHYIFLLDK